MLETLLIKIFIAAIVLFILIIINGRRIWQYRVYIALFFFLYFADNLLIIFSNLSPNFQLIPNHIWGGFLICSWSGKLYSIIFTLLLLYITRRKLTFNEAGLTLQQQKGSLLPSILVTMLLAVWAAWIGFSSPKGHFDAVALVYLAVMPGLNEELVYRGYLLGLLNKFMPLKFNLIGAGIGWGVIVTTVLFSLLHGFRLEGHYSIHFDSIALVNSFFTGFIFAWLRERTGSLVMPVIAHGMVDFLYFLPRML